MCRVVGVCGVPFYRIYALDEDGHIMRPSVVVECMTDTEALEAAKHQTNCFAVEVWQGSRRVERLEKRA